MVKFSVIGEILGSGMNDDGVLGFITIVPVVVPGQGVAPADPVGERPAPLRVRYAPASFGPADKALLAPGTKVQIDGLVGVFFKDKAPRLDGYGRPMPQQGGAASRPYTNYYHQLSKIQKAAA